MTKREHKNVARALNVINRRGAASTEMVALTLNVSLDAARAAVARLESAGRIVNTRAQLWITP